MTPAGLAPASVSVVVHCAGCTSLRLERDQLRRLLIAKEERLDAERRHSADLERRVLRHLPTWEPQAPEPTGPVGSNTHQPRRSG